MLCAYLFEHSMYCTDDLNDELREYGRLMIITTFSLIDIP